MAQIKTKNQAYSATIKSMDTSQILLKEEELITFLIHKAFLDMEGAQNWHTQVIESMDTSQSPLRTEKDRKFPTVIQKSLGEEAQTGSIYGASLAKPVEM